jgi:hypothetical protein
MKQDILTRLGFFLQQAITNTEDKKFTRVSQALLPMLPEIAEALKRIAIGDGDGTTAQKLQAIEMILQCWNRCLKVEDRKQNHLTKREQLKIRKTRVEADDRKAKLAIAAERRQIDATLKKARVEMEGK